MQEKSIFGPLVNFKVLPEKGINDAGGGGGGTEPPEDGKTQTPDSEGNQTEGNQVSDGDKRFSQAELDAIISERLARAGEKAKKEAERAREKAEQDALANQEKWQELAETRAKKITELEAMVDKIEPLSQKAERAEKALEVYLKAERDGLAKPIIDLLDRLDTVDQLEWLATNKKEVSAPKNPLPKTPKGANPEDLTQEVKQTAQTQTDQMYKNLWN